MKRGYFFFLCTLGTILLSFSSLSNEKNLYRQGNDSYLEGDYSKAISSYQKILENGLVNSGIYYNLANSYFRNSQLAEAIFYYRKAHQLSPHDADILFNLNYARSQSVDKIEQKKSWTTHLSSLFSLFSEKMTYLLLSFFGGLMTLFSLVSLFYRPLSLSEAFKWPSRICLLGIFYFFLSLIQWEFFPLSFGVIKEQTKIYSGAGKNNVTLFSLHEGAEFKPRETRKGSDSKEWLRIQLQDGKQGWVPIHKTLKTHP